MIEKNQFEEAYAFELPSQSTSLDSFFSAKVSPTGGQEKSRECFSTENHAFHVNMDFVSGEVEGFIEPLPNLETPGVGIGHSCIHFGEVQPISGIHPYLEIFVIRANNNAVHADKDFRSGDSPVKVTSEDIVPPEKNIQTNKIANDGRLSQVDEKRREDIFAFKDESTDMKNSRNDYFLVIRGYLPSVAMEMDESYSSPNLREKKITDDASLSSQGFKYLPEPSKRSSDRNLINFRQDFSLKLGTNESRFASIQLCQLSSSDGEIRKSNRLDLFVSKENHTSFAIFIADTKQVHLYKLQIKYHTLEYVHSNRVPILNMGPLIPIHDDKLDSNLTLEQDFMCLLVEGSLTPDHSKATHLNPFMFLSPITTMAVYRSETVIYLIVACFDGVIRFITMAHCNEADQSVVNLNVEKFQNGECRVINVTDFVVDGPIPSLSFSSISSASELKIFAGSMCGCAFYFEQNSTGIFKGPYPIVQGLWNSKLNEEDSILSIGDFLFGGVQVVVVGMFSGNILLFSPQCNVATKQYRCISNLTLPYPIHGFRVINLDEVLPDLLILTRRSLHLFKCNPTKLIEACLE